MALKRCDKGHYYDPTSHSSCPSCGYNLDFQATQAHKSPDADSEAVTQARGNLGGEVITQARNAPVVKPQDIAARQRDNGITVAIVRKNIGIDPVVGWLVCVEGAEKGKDYRIRSEKNYIGRDSSMDICIGGDTTISRENHAMISFNPRNFRFSIAPGSSRGLVYLNGEEVGIPEDLKPYDLIELGQSKLLFIAFCGEKFQWE